MGQKGFAHGLADTQVRTVGADTVAILEAPRNLDRAPSEAPRPFGQLSRSEWRQPRHYSDGERLLVVQIIIQQVGRGTFLQLEPRAPILQNAVGRPVIESTVDFAASARAARFHKSDWPRSDRWIQSPGAVLLGHLADAERRTGFLRKIGAFFDDDDTPASLREHLGRHRSARTGANHGDVGF